MNRAVRMLISAAVASFVAGVGAGIALPALATGLRDDIEPNRDEIWVRNHGNMLGDRLDLSQDRRRLVLAILQRNVDDEVRIARDADYSEWPQHLQRRLKEARDRMERRIRTILSESQRELYDALSAARDVSAAVSGEHDGKD